MTQVGFIGLGAIGIRMLKIIEKEKKKKIKEIRNIIHYYLTDFATHLQEKAKKEGQFIYVYNRTKEKSIPLLNIGAKEAESTQQLANHCDIVFSCVLNDSALEDVFLQVFIIIILLFFF